MPFSEFTRLSPNRSALVHHEQLGVCFHHSVSPFTETIEKMSNLASRVSYHLLIDRDGTRCRLVEDDQVAWHAGISSFKERAGCNGFLLGVSFAGDTYSEPLTTEQIESALEWLGSKWEARRWSLGDMTDHRQIAPGRKDDLNPIEWTRLLGRIGSRFGV